jgi:hypothetical protein
VARPRAKHRPGRDKKPRHADSLAVSSRLLTIVILVLVVTSQKQNPVEGSYVQGFDHGAASCRCATPPL